MIRSTSFEDNQVHKPLVLVHDPLHRYWQKPRRLEDYLWMESLYIVCSLLTLFIVTVCLVCLKLITATEELGRTRPSRSKTAHRKVSNKSREARELKRQIRLQVRREIDGIGQLPAESQNLEVRDNVKRSSTHGSTEAPRWLENSPQYKENLCRIKTQNVNEITVIPDLHKSTS